MGVDVWGVCPLIQVFDMPASIAFYQGVLGFEIAGHSGLEPVETWGWALLRKNGAEVMLNTAYDDGERPPHPDPPRVAAHGDTILYFGCKDLDGAYEHLRSHGLKVNPPKTAPYGMRQLYLKDPDGFGLCFQWPDTEETRESWRKAYGVDT